MSLILYGVPLSPFVRKVRLCLAEKALDYQLEIISPFDQPSWYKEINPLNRIPAIKVGEFTLADSSVICQYLEEQYPQALSLMGDNAEQNARVRWLAKYADDELAPLTTFSVFAQRVLSKSMGKECDEGVVQLTLTEKLPAHFDYLEQQLAGNDYFVAGKLTLADLAFSCQMVNMEHAGETIDATRWPYLSALYLRVKARASMQAMLPGEQNIIAKITA
ncbi:glutathione S-transferase family protein [Shewanella algidipiscicola]|uniref:Glutathione S-transferase n=1 Tax=Shewanella algidipiscicola TaxID=614070 RepID=A0ABQ4PLT6_9GAMM|nr:glutathione S-transferase family protein [Shewanella algidipiscicola]GIU49128.1 glutathione S-transferase [Shewanella algidipiscicola]